MRGLGARRAVLVGTVGLGLVGVTAGLGLGQAGASTTAAGRPAAAKAVAVTWLSWTNGRLGYGQDAQGNRIPDFSYAGYGGGGRPLPVAPVAARVAARTSGDDTARIQAAINAVARRTPARDGLRGAVLLAPGTYRLKGTLHIGASGVVLRGSGSGAKGTLLQGQGSPHALVSVSGTGSPVGAGANQVLWNANVGYYAVQNPPTVHNWAFGTRGAPVGTQTGVLVSTGRAVAPASLYSEQLRERG